MICRRSLNVVQCPATHTVKPRCSMVNCLAYATSKIACGSQITLVSTRTFLTACQTRGNFRNVSCKRGQQNRSKGAQSRYKIILGRRLLLGSAAFAAFAVATRLLRQTSSDLPAELSPVLCSPHREPAAYQGIHGQRPAGVITSLSGWSSNGAGGCGHNTLISPWHACRSARTETGCCDQGSYVCC